MIINYAAIKTGLAQGMPGHKIIKEIDSTHGHEGIDETPVKNKLAGPAQEKLWIDIFDDIYKNNSVPLNTLFKKQTVMEG